MSINVGKMYPELFYSIKKSMSIEAKKEGELSIKDKKKLLPFVLEKIKEIKLYDYNSQLLVWNHNILYACGFKKIKNNISNFINNQTVLRGALKEWCPFRLITGKHLAFSAI